MSSSEHHVTNPTMEGEQDEEGYLEADDVYEVIADEGDVPMDEDENDELGGLPESGMVIRDDMSGEGDIIYEDNSIQHFGSHKQSVFAVSAHPTAPIAASGGEDDLGYVWNIESGEEVVKLGGHTDSVSAVGFSADGEMVATGGMDGRVRVWRRVGQDNWKTWEFLTELQGPDEVIWLRWHPKGAVLLAGSNDSTVWLWKLPSGDTMQVFAGHLGPVQCGEFTPDGKRIVTACAENTLIYWDPRSPNPIFKLSPTDARFNLDGITSLAINPASTLAVVSGAAGGVRVVSLNKGEVISALGGHTDGESVESAVFVNIVGAVGGSGAASSGGTVVTGGTDGKACIWDLNTMRLRATLAHQDSVTTLLVHPTKPYLVVSGSADKTLRTWDARSGILVREHKGHHGPVLGAALAMEGSMVITAGDDGACLVFGTE